MDTFLREHAAAIVGTISTFDRIIFKGYLTVLQTPYGMSRFLESQGQDIEDFGRFVERQSERVKEHAQQMAREKGRPYEYNAEGMTRQTGQTKEQWAREIAQRDGVKEGLIAVLGTVEPCTSFRMVGDRQGKRLERRRRKCLHLYYYLIDHIRVQTWFPFTVQIYINGREWLARQLEDRGISYQKRENCINGVGDLEVVKELCKGFEEKQWVNVLNAFGRRVNPLMSLLNANGCGEYYWVTDQCEYATDILLKSRNELEKIYPDLIRYATTTFGAKDIMGFLGRKLHGNFEGEVITDSKERQQGWRVKYYVKGNSLKMYDKGSVLRIETTINQPQEFKILRRVKEGQEYQLKWTAMRKGVTNFYRYAEVSLQANMRYAEALANAPMNGKIIEQIDELCRSKTNQNKRIGKFNPLSREDSQLFAALLRGENVVNGVRNGDLQASLYDKPAPDPADKRRRTGRVSRLIAKLRGHGLLAKVTKSRLYRLTAKGLALLKAIVHFRNVTTPTQVLASA